MTAVDVCSRSEGLVELVVLGEGKGAAEREEDAAAAEAVQPARTMSYLQEPKISHDSPALGFVAGQMSTGSTSAQGSQDSPKGLPGSAAAL